MVPLVGILGRDLERDLLAAAADQERQGFCTGFGSSVASVS